MRVHKHSILVLVFIFTFNKFIESALKIQFNTFNNQYLNTLFHPAEASKKNSLTPPNKGARVNIESHEINDNAYTIVSITFWIPKNYY